MVVKWKTFGRVTFIGDARGKIVGAVQWLTIGRATFTGEAKGRLLVQCRATFTGDASLTDGRPSLHETLSVVCRESKKFALHISFLSRGCEL